MNDEGSSPKESGCIVLASLPIFEIVSAASIGLTTSVVLHYLASQQQYHIVANYRIVPLKCCQLNCKTILVLGNILRFFSYKRNIVKYI